MQNPGSPYARARVRIRNICVGMRTPVWVEEVDIYKPNDLRIFVRQMKEALHFLMYTESIRPTDPEWLIRSCCRSKLRNGKLGLARQFIEWLPPKCMHVKNDRLSPCMVQQTILKK